MGGGNLKSKKVSVISSKKIYVIDSKTKIQKVIQLHILF